MDPSPRPLKVVHCLRAPVGGLFRHVCDLARGQAQRGHDVGVVCDARTGDALTESKLKQLETDLTLGLMRVNMHRQIAASDLSAALKVRRWCRERQIDVIHGHGAKGGAFARFAAIAAPMRSLYTPHGGSLHYSRSSPAGLIFLTLENLLSRATDGLIFESAYGRDTYGSKVGTPHCPVQVINNGLTELEFEPVLPASDAADFIFIGELRELKGIDVLLNALHRLEDANAVIVGAGPDAQRFHDLARELGIDGRVEFTGALPARQAFSRGRTLIVPSRAESFPYIVLEAIAARVPLIATCVGGIPEIFGDYSPSLIPAGDVTALATAMNTARSQSEAADRQADALLARAQAEFSAEAMVEAVLRFYATCLPDQPVATGNAGSPTPAE
jgi:glycosyltransferase involved in cell wall biosynthesis